MKCPTSLFLTQSVVQAEVDSRKDELAMLHDELERNRARSLEDAYYYGLPPSVIVQAASVDNTLRRQQRGRDAALMNDPTKVGTMHQLRLFVC